MGQAKQRGSKEQRFNEAVNRYRQKIEQLSEYGLPMDVLNNLIKGDESVASQYLQQVKQIEAQYSNAVNIRLFIKDNHLNVDVETDGSEQTYNKQEQDLQDSLNKLKQLRPKSMPYTLKIANTSKEVLDKTYSLDNSFDLPLNKTASYFEKLLSKSFPDMQKDGRVYYAEMLNLYSNHPSCADKEQSFFIES